MTEASDPYEVGRIIALRALDRAPHSSGQILDLLRRRGVPDEPARAVVQRLTEVDLIDDVAYGRMWVESRLRSRGMSRRALREELKRRRLDPDTIDTVLDELSPDSEFDAAVESVATRLRRQGLPEDDKSRRRILGQLQRRGHGWDASQQILARAVEAVRLEQEAG